MSCDRQTKFHYLVFGYLTSYLFCFTSWPDMSNPGERINYVQDSSSDTETDYKEMDSRGRHRVYKNRFG